MVIDRRSLGLGGPKAIPLETRFWRCVNKTESCWLWTGTRFNSGYGYTHKMLPGGKRKGLRAHRVSYELAYGLIPDGMILLHSCDVKLCVNPDHLTIGTSRLNVADMVNKNRQAKGEQHGSAKLTADKVREIRRLSGSGLSYPEIAAMFNVDRSSIGLIVRRVNWAHIT